MVLHPDYHNLPQPAHKSIPLDDAFGEFIGLAKFSKDGLSGLFKEMDAIVEAKRWRLSFQAIERMVENGFPVDILETKGRLWNDNDTLDNFKRTRKVIFPKIEKKYRQK